MTSVAWAQTPQSQCSVLSGRPCHPSFCGVFHRGPCLPYYLPPIGEDLRLTIVSTDDNDPADNIRPRAAGPAIRPAAQNAKPADEQPLDSIGAMFAALRACWVPPPKDEARHGMEYTIRFAFKRDGEIVAPPRVTYASHDAPADVRDVYRDAVNAALKRCTPLHFSDGMGGAVAGRPIAIRFVDNRTGDKANRCSELRCRLISGSSARAKARANPLHHGGRRNPSHAAGGRPALGHDGVDEFRIFQHRRRAEQRKRVGRCGSGEVHRAGIGADEEIGEAKQRNRLDERRDRRH